MKDPRAWRNYFHRSFRYAREFRNCRLWFGEWFDEHRFTGVKGHTNGYAQRKELIDGLPFLLNAYMNEKTFFHEFHDPGREIHKD
jgi:hypothetical protein